MIKEKIQTKKRTLSITLLLMFVALAISVNINTIQTYAYENESTDYETQYYELTPILEKNLYEAEEQINVSFDLDSQYDLFNVTYEAEGFTLATPLIVNENNISVVLDYTSTDNAEFVISVETTSEKIIVSRIYGYLKDSGFVISQYPAKNIGSFTNGANNQGGLTPMGLFDTVAISGQLSWTDESNNVHILRRTKYEYGFAIILGDNSYAPVLAGTEYTDDSGNYSVTLNNPLGLDIFITAYATGRSAGSTGKSVTVFQNGGIINQYENFVYLPNPSSQTLTMDHTITSSGIADEDKEIVRSFEICQAIIKGAEYVKEMRDGIDTPHVNVIYPSGLASNPNVGNGRAAYFSIPTSTIYIPNGRINWDTLYHEYGHHIGFKLGIDDHPAQNIELYIGWPPIVFDLDYKHSMFNSTTYSNYTKSQHIRITWAEAYAYYLSMMIRHYYLEDFNEIPTSSAVRYFSITYGVDEGEASVSAIQSVLWSTYKDILNAGRNINDIATGSSSTKEAIKYTHKVMWNILSDSQTNSTMKSYSAYADYFTNNYPEHRSEFGRISAIHGMSPIDIILTTYSESISPTIFWQNSFESTNYKVNKYSLIFYDSSNEEILRINDINTTSYKLSDADWTQIKNNFGTGDHVNIHVLAFQTNTPTTGGFISQAVKLSNLIYTPINNGNAYSVTKIFNKQFAGSIEILDEYEGAPVTQIGDSVFENCTSLTEITLPNNLTSIGNSTFKGCTSLNNVTISSSITNIGLNAFEGCTSLNNVVREFEYYISNNCYYLTRENWIHENLKVDGAVVQITGNITPLYLANGKHTIEIQTNDISSIINTPVLEKVERLYLDLNQDVKSNVENGKNVFYFNNFGGRFVTFTLEASSYTGDYFENAIKIRDLNGVIEKFTVDWISNEAKNIDGSNTITVYLPTTKIYYVEVNFTDTAEISELKLTARLLDNLSQVDLFDLDEDVTSSISLFDNTTSSGDELKAIEILQSGRFYFQGYYTLSSTTNPIFVVIKETIVDNEVRREIVPTGVGIMNSYFTTTVYLEPGKYYIGYFNTVVGEEIEIWVYRFVDQSGSQVLVTDPGSQTPCGSQINIIEKDIAPLYRSYRSSNITEGFTRLIYPDYNYGVSASRLDYDWYSSNTNVATVTRYGTVLALPVTADTTVKIMAVLKADYSKVFVKEFTVCKDLELTGGYVNREAMVNDFLDDYTAFYNVKVGASLSRMTLLGPNDPGYDVGTAFIGRNYNTTAQLGYFFNDEAYKDKWMWMVEYLENVVAPGNKQTFTDILNGGGTSSPPPGGPRWEIWAFLAERNDASITTADYTDSDNANGFWYLLKRPIEIKIDITISAGQGAAMMIPLDAATVPINILQYYTWSTDDPNYVTFSPWGGVNIDPLELGQTVTLLGSYTLNSRVTIIIEVEAI